MSTVNMNTTSADSVGLSPVLIALRTCFIAIIALLIISGNILSIAVTRRVTNLADSTKILMTSLAVYDLLLGVMTLLTVVVSALDRWPFGYVCCAFYAVLIGGSFFMSILSLTYLNIERYIAVTRPYKYPVWCTRRRTILLVAVSPIICLTTETLILISDIIRAEYLSGAVICYNTNELNYFNASSALWAYVLPLIFMLFIYYQLIKISRQHECRLNQNVNNEANNNHNNKALKTFLVVTLTFACCWTPLILSRTIEMLTGALGPNWLQFLTLWLATCNSMCNVWIYCLFNSSFRQMAKTILSERFPCCNRSVAPVVI
ncbi:histamine H2 receptor-like [Asterias amurensis]|uniref:histamine H2 receptor-like n=1 Tax=Asterias amurensis TaxID=7602 RepID=UPI003AB4075E